MQANNHIKNVPVNGTFLFFKQFVKGVKMIFMKIAGWKKKKIIMGGCILFIVVMLIIIFILVKPGSKLLILKRNVITVEYGQPISTDPKDYLNLNDLDRKRKKDILKNIRFKSNINNEVETVTNPDGTISEKDKGYAAVGDYTITLSYKGEIETIKVRVKDTIAPELTVPERVEITQGTDLAAYDFKSLMTAADLALMSDFIFDISSVNVNLPGEYMARVSIEDANKNKTEKEFKIIIITSPAKDEEVIQEVVTNEDGTKSVKVITKKKDTNQSSSSINNNSTAKPASGNSSTSMSSSDTPNNTYKPSDSSNINEGSGNGGSSGSSSSSGSTITKKYIEVSWSYKLGASTMNDSWVGSEDNWSESLVYLPTDAYDYTGISKRYITYEEYKYIMGY